MLLVCAHECVVLGHSVRFGSAPDSDKLCVAGRGEGGDRCGAGTASILFRWRREFTEWDHA